MSTQPDNKLSSRELEIINLAANGLCDKEIAVRLGVHLSTVRTYWERIRFKTASRSRTHAVCLVLFSRVAKPAATFDASAISVR